MNILWITNTIFPAPSKELGIPEPVFGGWMYSTAIQISKQPGFNIAIATVFGGGKVELKVIDDIKYYLLPVKNINSYQKSLEKVWENICLELKPDIIHIHGTEFPHGLACMNSYSNAKYVVSIQGLVGVISRYFFSGISNEEIFRSITLRDLFKFDTLFQHKKKFSLRGEYERKYIEKTKFVSGRTFWDFAHAKAINPLINYYPINRTLRDSLYHAAKWSNESKTTHSIFLSQSSSPIKGLHQVLKAIAILKPDFPNIQIRVAGRNILCKESLYENIKRTGYGLYLMKLIKKLDLKSHVHFTGLLPEEKMIREYQNAHIFISPSSIENSSNSIAEAQILGVPTIGSYVGGTMDMIHHGVNGFLYRFEEVEMLAEYIRIIFNDDDLANSLSKQGIQDALGRHDPTINLSAYIEMYNKINIHK